jgi:hypothetical protein
MPVVVLVECDPPPEPVPVPILEVEPVECVAVVEPNPVVVPVVCEPAPVFPPEPIPVLGWKELEPEVVPVVCVVVLPIEWVEAPVFAVACPPPPPEEGLCEAPPPPPPPEGWEVFAGGLEVPPLGFPLSLSLLAAWLDQVRSPVSSTAVERFLAALRREQMVIATSFLSSSGSRLEMDVRFLHPRPSTRPGSSEDVSLPD